MRDKIRQVFDSVWREQKDTDPPAIADKTILLDTGLDSLGFAIIVTRLEEDLGYDPFSLAEDAVYPQTFKEFVDFYELHRPE
ncbi:MAG: acyl carrier protein [Pseudomonadota bacterium]